MRNAIILSIAVAVGACGGQMREEPDRSATEVTTSFIPAGKLEQVRREAESGDASSAYLLSLETGSREWLERAHEGGWPQATRDIGLELVRKDPCRVGEARQLIESYQRGYPEHSSDEDRYLRQVLADAEKGASGCESGNAASIE